MDTEDYQEFAKATIHPLRLDYGVVSAGFLYNLQFSVQNNTKSPMRIRVSCAAVKGEQNTIRLINLPEIVAPGLASTLNLELTAEFPMNSKFTISVSQNHSNVIYTKDVEANVVSSETFKHVKKSLVLQKRPIYQPNVRVIANIPFFDSMNDDLQNFSSATFSDAVLMDEEDIDDLLSLPMAYNVYWDPFEKCLRLDPLLGKVIVDPSCSMEENKKKTAEEREARMIELEEQGFLTSGIIERMREDRLHQQLNSPGLRTASNSAILPLHQESSTSYLGRDLGNDDKVLADGMNTPAEESANPTETDDGGAEYGDEGTRRDLDIEEAEQDDTFAEMGLQTVHTEDDGDCSPGRTFSGKISVSFSGDDIQHTTTNSSYGMLSINSPNSSSSVASRMSVTSLLAMKRERIERQRRESIQIASNFLYNSKNDAKIDMNRTLNMIKGRNKPHGLSAISIPE